MTPSLWAAAFFGLLLPLSMIACWPVFRYHSRHGPNSWSGFRTERAMQSRESWQLAQTMCGRHWLRLGLLLAVLGAGVYSVLYRAGVLDPDTWWWVALALTFAPLPGILWSAAMIERALKASEHAAHPSP